MSAYACEPGQGSEPGAGWEWSRAAALENEVWLLTRKNNAEKIDAALRDEPHLKICPVYIDLPEWASWWKKGTRGVRIYYFLWQLLALKRARALHLKVQFDLAHHVTLAIDWLPAGIAWAGRMPFIWGPVGGSTTIPLRLWKWLGWKGSVHEVLRALITTPLRHLFGKLTARRAAILVAQNKEVARAFSTHPRVITEPDVAVEVPSPLTEARKTKVAVYAGNLLPLKGLRLAIAAIHALSDSRWQLHIFGAGKDYMALKKRAIDLNLESRVIFHGKRPRADVLRALETASLFVFPSLHDAAGWAVAEALSRGCPVVCLDIGGPAFLVAESGGRVVSTGPNMKMRFADAIASDFVPVENRHRWSKDRIPIILKGWYASV